VRKGPSRRPAGHKSATERVRGADDVLEPAEGDLGHGVDGGGIGTGVGGADAGDHAEGRDDDDGGHTEAGLDGAGGFTAVGQGGQRPPRSPLALQQVRRLQLVDDDNLGAVGRQPWRERASVCVCVRGWVVVVRCGGYKDAQRGAWTENM